LAGVLKTPVDVEPEVDLVPAQELEAVHEVALVVLQERVVDDPAVTLVDVALREIVGVGRTAWVGVGVVVFFIVVVGVDTDVTDLLADEVVLDAVVEVDVVDEGEYSVGDEVIAVVEDCLSEGADRVDKRLTLPAGLHRDNEPANWDEPEELIAELGSIPKLKLEVWSIGDKLKLIVEVSPVTQLSKVLGLPPLML
jgi:hypothetical protein